MIYNGWTFKEKLKMTDKFTQDRPTHRETETNTNSNNHIITNVIYTTTTKKTAVSISCYFLVRVVVEVSYLKCPI